MERIMRESIFEADYRENRKDGETFYDYLRGRMIAVDTEYQTTEKVVPESFIERYTGIHKVFCAAFASSKCEWVVWIDPTKPDSYKNILADAAERLGIPDPIFVNFAFEAEWEAFHRLGDTPESYPWLDCYLLYRLKDWHSMPQTVNTPRSYDILRNYQPFRHGNNKSVSPFLVL